MFVKLAKCSICRILAENMEFSLPYFVIFDTFYALQALQLTEFIHQGVQRVDILHIEAHFALEYTIGAA